jgi:hypothetical protein
MFAKRSARTIEFKGIQTVTLRGNEGGRADGGHGPRWPQGLRDNRREAPEYRPARGGAAAQRDAGQHDGLGSERGLATPSPDGKGENLNPVTVDHAAGFLRHARTQL